MNTQNSFEGFDDLESDLDKVETKAPHSKYGSKRYPCIKCCGTGKYMSIRIHQEKSECFTCKGKGYFMSSPEKRIKSKERRDNKRAETEALKAEANKDKADQWIAQHRDLYEYLQEVKSWNDFALKLIESVARWGGLTDRQQESAESMMARHLIKKKSQETTNQDRTMIDLTRIWELFNTALSNGLEKPKLRVGSLVISIAPAYGRNVGSLYVKDSKNYSGKITPEGKWFPLSSARKEIGQELIELAADPRGQAVAYGMRTGKCSCCGRKLTNKTSVELGIGPICLGKWGM
jgi:hypothetical protein